MGLGNEVLLEVRDGTAIITFNRPEKLNTMNHAFLDGLEDAFNRIEDDQSIHALIFTGAETRAFTCGIDVNMFGEDSHTARAFVMRELTVLYDRAVRLPVPIIAAIEGYAYATGSEFTLCCDMAYAGESVTFCFADLNLGLAPGIASCRVMEKLNRMRISELMYKGATFSAQEAFDIGLITRVVPDGEALKTALETARTISEKAPMAVRTLKRALNRHYADDWMFSLDLERAPLASADFAEGVRAFKERRPPRFTGR